MTAEVDRVHKSSPRHVYGAHLYEYEWRKRTRRVWVCITRKSFNTVLDQHWPRRTTSVDVEYNSQDGQGGVPRVISIAIDRTTAILWHRPGKHLSRRLPSLLVRVLSNAGMPKIGFAIDNDMHRIAQHTDFLERGGWARGTLDLQTWWRVFGPGQEFSRSIGLADAVERYTGTSVLKHMRLGRWDASELNLDQIVYAAGDVLATLDMWSRVRQRHHHSHSSPPVTPVKDKRSAVFWEWIRLYRKTIGVENHEELHMLQDVERSTRLRFARLWHTMVEHVVRRLERIQSLNDKTDAELVLIASTIVLRGRDAVKHLLQTLDVHSLAHVLTAQPLIATVDRTTGRLVN